MIELNEDRLQTATWHADKAGKQQSDYESRLNSALCAFVHNMDNDSPAASKRMEAEVVKLLLKHGADANGDKSLFPPLPIAAGQLRFDIVKLLVSFGADVNKRHNLYELQGEGGNTALHILAFTFGMGIRNNRRERRMVKFLLRNGARLDVKNGNNHTAYDIATNEMKAFVNSERRRSQIGNVICLLYLLYLLYRMIIIE